MMESILHSLFMIMIKDAIEKYQQEKGKKIQLKAVLFDMDGVLFDSMPNHTQAWHQTMTELGFHCSRDEFYLFEGATSSYTINRYYHKTHGRNVSEEERKTIYHRKTLHFNALPVADPMPYALEVLSAVKACGLTPVLVTGSGQKSLLERLNKHFPGVFEQHLMVTAYDVHHGKPHPEPYLLGLKKAGIEAHEAIVVENAPLGVQAAVAAGIFTVAVNTGPIDDRVLLNDGANLLLQSMEELYRDLEELFDIIG